MYTYLGVEKTEMPEFEQFSWKFTFFWSKFDLSPQNSKNMQKCRQFIKKVRHTIPNGTS